MTTREPRLKWTAEDIATLTARFPNELTSVIALDLGLAVHQVSAKAFALGLKKTPEHLAKHRLQPGSQIGAAHRFKPGHNGGPGGGQAAQRHPRVIASRFKPGHRPAKTVPIGTLALSKDGYLKRKVADITPSRKGWELEHRLIWMAFRGEIPESHAVCFKDGDRTHVHLDNLELRARADIARANSIHNLPKPLADVIRLKGALTRSINNRERKLNSPRHADTGHADRSAHDAV
jgi:hypothetical protein